MNNLNFSRIEINIPEKSKKISISNELIIDITYPAHPKTLMIVKVKNITKKWLKILIKTSPVNKVIDLGPCQTSLPYDLLKENFIIQYEERKAPYWLRKK